MVTKRSSEHESDDGKCDVTQDWMIDRQRQCQGRKLEKERLNGLEATHNVQGITEHTCFEGLLLGGWFQYEQS